MSLTVHNPTLAKTPQFLPIAPRGRPLEGQLWGLVDTSKVNADRFIAELQKEIQKNYHPRGFAVIRKESPGIPLSAEQIERLASECGFVVFCFGD